MIISRLIIKNWKNFKNVDISFKDRMFIIGPNASGKSNLLDVFRFLRDIVKQGGGFQKAVSDRGGMGKIRCLAARKDPEVSIEIHISESNSDDPLWKYAIGIRQEPRGKHQPYLSFEKIWKEDLLLVNRPNKDDDKDPERLTQTFLEQINANKDFRDISKFLEKVLYLHLVPQLLKYPNAFSGPDLPGDPFGRGFLDRLAKTSPKTRDSRLKKIGLALRYAVPQLNDLHFMQDENGKPHLEVRYEHWRPDAGKQQEDQFSDGTLRLIALLWSLQEGDGLLLLEEPELSLNGAIVSKIPGMVYNIQKSKKRQIVMTTHSSDLLSDKGISRYEVALLTPDSEGTKMELAASKKEVVEMLNAGMTPAEAIIPKTRPANIEQLKFDF